MAWEQDISNASFRGVPFTTEGASGSHGRRGTDHQFPGRDKPYAEDAGRRQRSWPVTGHIAGSDYLRDLAKMINASEREGPGVLVHPYFGKMDVVCRDFSWTLSFSHGGLAEISFLAVEAGALENPSEAVSTADTVSEASSQLLDAAEDDYGALDDVARSTYVAAQWTENASDKVTLVLDALIGPFTYTVDNILDVTSALAQVDQELQTAAASPSVVASRLKTALLILGSISVVKAFTGEDSQQAEALGATATPDEANLQLHLEANRALYQRMMIARQAALLAAQDFTDYEQAIAERNALSSLIDAELLLDPPDPVVAALVDMQTATQNDINVRAQTLPRIRDINLPTAQPSLALAQELYGDATRSGEIETRNNTPHPAFVIGDIQVLTK